MQPKKKRKDKFVNTIILSQEKELWVLAAALIPGGLLPRFPDINSNSLPLPICWNIRWSRDNQGFEFLIIKMSGNTRGYYDSCGLSGWARLYEKRSQYM